MPIEIEIRPLRQDDDRSRFSCGQADLDRYFEHYAGQNQFKLHLGVTYVAIVRDNILGFATIAASSIARESLPTRRLQKRLPNYPLPILRLARLGVDSRAQGMGIGTKLMCHIFALALQQRNALGCIGVVTDAKPDSRSYYESLGFVPLAGVREGALHGEPTPMFLPLARISSEHTTRVATKIGGEEFVCVLEPWDAQVVAQIHAILSGEQFPYYVENELYAMGSPGIGDAKMRLMVPRSVSELVLGKLRNSGHA